MTVCPRSADSISSHGYMSYLCTDTYHGESKSMDLMRDCYTMIFKALLQLALLAVGVLGEIAGQLRWFDLLQFRMALSLF